MKKLLGASALALSVVLLAGGLPVRSQEVVIKGEVINPAPQEVLDEFHEALQSTDAYETAKALKLEMVLPVVEDLREEYGYTIEVETVNFAEEYMDYMHGGIEQHAAKRTDSGFIEFSLDFKTDTEGERHWVLSRYDDVRDVHQSYLFDDELPEAYDFEFVKRVRVIHPLLEERYDCSARNANFADFVADFCGRYGVEYSLASDDTVERITIQMQDRSFMSCIHQAARSVQRAVYTDTGVYSPRIDYYEVYERLPGLSAEQAFLQIVQESVDTIHENPVCVSFSHPKDREAYERYEKNRR